MNLLNKKKILLILGPNLNMVGIRDTGIYGNESADSIQLQILEYSKKNGYIMEIFQSNWEGAIIDKIHKAKDDFDAVIINAGALSHYSLSIRDAITCIKIPFIEVHMSNIYAREEFRKNSVITDVCAGQIVGFGKYSYFLAIDAIKRLV